MQEVGEFPVLNRHGVPIVPVVLNGHATIFYVDTGAGVSAIAPAAMSSLGLSSSGSDHFAIAGVSGNVSAPVVRVQDLAIGSMRAHDVLLAETGRFGTYEKRPISGLFGADFLSNDDVEVDLPHGRIGLYREQGACGSDFDPWDEPAAVTHDRLDASGHVVLPIVLDGANMDAILDTGAQVSTIDFADARRAGVADAALATDRTFGLEDVAGVTARARLHRFASLSVGRQETGPAVFAVVDTTDPLLGETWIRHHTIWISYPHDVVLVQIPPSSPATH